MSVHCDPPPPNPIVCPFYDSAQNCNAPLDSAPNGNAPLDSTPNDNVSLLYIKRKRTDHPTNSSLFVQLSAKRQKTFQEFKFVTSTLEEPLKHDREDLLRKYKHENTVSSIKDRCRREVQLSRQKHRFDILSTAREGGGGAVFSAALTDDPAADIPADSAVDIDEDDIVCNATRMFSQKLSLSERTAPFVSNGSEEWVYDVYVCDNPCEGEIADIQCDFEPVTKERYINEYEEDSNDENYWANDYPDEEDTSSGDSECSDSVARSKRYSNEYFDDGDLLDRSHYLDKYLVSDTDSD